MVNKTLNSNKVKVAKFLRDIEINKKEFYTVHIGEGVDMVTIFFTEINIEYGRTIYLKYNGLLISIFNIDNTKIDFVI